MNMSKKIEPIKQTMLQKEKIKYLPSSPSDSAIIGILELVNKVPHYMIIAAITIPVSPIISAQY